MSLNVINLYRVGNWCYKKGIPFIPSLTKHINHLMFNSIVPFNATIGKNSTFAYGGIGCVIHSKTIIGERVLIGQNTTIGRSLDPDDYPISIGNDVYISAGVRIIGKIKIGNNVIIGANAVVNKDIEDNSIVVGVPCKVIRHIDCSIWELLKNIHL